MTIFHIKSKKNISDVAAEIFSKLGIHEFSEHESSNYPPLNLYFKAQLDATTYKICAEDDADYHDYQYWLIVSTNLANASEAQMLNNSLLETLNRLGYETVLDVEH